MPKRDYMKIEIMGSTGGDIAFSCILPKPPDMPWHDFTVACGRGILMGEDMIIY